MPTSNLLNDQVTLVTGSSRGLGKAIAEALHDHGASIVINYLNSKDHAEAIAEDLKGIAIQADVTDRMAVESMFKAAQDYFGRPISIVVNNALDYKFNGDKKPKLKDMTWSQFDSQLKTTLQGALNTTQAGMEHVSSIINIGSNLFQNPAVPYQDYTAAKAALLGFTRTTAKELGGRTRCNMVSSGLIRTTDASRDTPEDVFQQIEAVTPLGRVVTPLDVANAVVFFAGPLSDGITGQQLVVDGGLCMN